MKNLSPPPVPAKLREMLKDYPEHIERLQEVLNDYARKPSRLMPFDGAIWALEGRLETFYSEARAELQAAEASGDAAAIARAEAKELLMGRASSKGRWITDKSFGEYFQTHKGTFE